MLQFSVIVEYKINDGPLEKETIQVEVGNLQSVETLKQLIYDLQKNELLHIWQVLCAPLVEIPEEHWQYTIHQLTSQDILSFDEKTNMLEQVGIMEYTDMHRAWVNVLTPERHEDFPGYSSINQNPIYSKNEVWIYTGHSVTCNVDKIIPFQLAMDGLLYFISNYHKMYDKIDWEAL